CCPGAIQNPPQQERAVFPLSEKPPPPPPPLLFPSGGCGASPTRHTSTAKSPAPCPLAARNSPLSENVSRGPFPSKWMRFSEPIRQSRKCPTYPDLGAIPSHLSSGENTSST